MLELAEIFTDYMVLQRGMPVCVYGKASCPGRIELGDKTAAFEPGADGSFRAYLPPMDSCEDTRLCIRAGQEKQTFTHVAIGEVFFAGGQSNMELRLEDALYCPEELEENPYLRFYEEPHSMRPEDDSQEEIYECSPQWQTADGKRQLRFSAIAYFFMRRMYRHFHCPIGVIGCYKGASRAEAWMSPEAYEQADLDKLLLDAHEDKFLYKFNLKHWLYLHKYAPVAAYTIRAVLWYQGESNRGSGEAKNYTQVFLEMARFWRRENGTPDLKFFTVQLMPFNGVDEKGKADWAALRQSQLRAAEMDGNVYMVTLLDSGESREIHPRHKREIGQALANAVLRECCAEPVEYSGPVLSGWQRRDDKLILCFDHAQGLELRGETPLDFVWRDESGAEQPVQAEIDGSTVSVLFREGFSKLCLGYRNAPAHNLYNAAGYLASPFQICFDKNK